MLKPHPDCFFFITTKVQTRLAWGILGCGLLHIIFGQAVTLMVFSQDSVEEQENLLLPYKRQDIYSFTRTMKHKYMHVCLYANMPTQRPESVSATKHPCQACR